MGVVGLNFGSPTSGVGFDVSTTVSEIVANLQNVETPWKSQLTTLASQDTAISSLGTLFSNLSNDISALTDATGVMAEKEGSSSDENVLTLTAATSSAIAGTHTVQVTNLAQTSSGYLAPIANASDTLSGSITLQVGTGAAQTITLRSSDNTLAGLAEAINSSSVGITASVLTDSSGSRLSLVSGTSGANGNITVSNNSIAAAVSNTLTSSVIAGTSTVTSTATLSPVATLADTLSGSISIQVGSNTAVVVNVPATSGNNNLNGLKNAINDTAGIGVVASIVTNSDGTSSLSLASATGGSAGTLTVNSSVADSVTAQNFALAVTGTNANLTVDGINLTSASNTVANLIPGVTFQLLAPSATESDGSLEQVQVVIANDNAGVESAVSAMVSDYNAAISGINAQEGNNSSGVAEPLYGSPTLSLLQQQLLGSLNTQNPNGYLDSISSTDGTTLSGSMAIQMGNGATDNFIVGSGSNSAVAGTYYTNNTDTDGVSNGNTLAGLAATINEANSSTALSYTAGTASTGTLTPVSNANDPLSGSISIQVGSGTTQTFIVGSGSDSAVSGTYYTDNTDTDGVNYGNNLTGLASAITAADSGVTPDVTTGSNGVATLAFDSGSNGALTVTSSLLDSGFGVTAGVATTSGQSSLTLASRTAGSSGALTVTSGIFASAPTALYYSDTGGYTSSTADSGTLTAIANANDALTGSMIVQVGSGTTQTFIVGTGSDSAIPGTFYTNNTDTGGVNNGNTLAGLAATITSADPGFTAVVNAAGTGLTLTSGTVGSAGSMIVTSSLLDTSSPTSTALNYNNSSDINSLTSLGISVNNDGSLTFDATSLDSVLNSDYNGVTGFFQDANSWGLNFSTMLTDAGTSSTTGVLALASSSNSNIESTLNADITKENSLISAEQSSLTTELNQANQIMQELPTQLEGINELYSAITGYDQNQNG